MALASFLVRWIALFFLKAYQVVLSPMMGSCCRFHPSCSNYASEAISRFGIIHGGKLAIKRLCRCHPACVGGEDPVPEE